MVYWLLKTLRWNFRSWWLYRISKTKILEFKIFSELAKINMKKWFQLTLWFYLTILNKIWWVVFQKSCGGFYQKSIVFVIFNFSKPTFTKAQLLTPNWQSFGWSWKVAFTTLISHTSFFETLLLNSRMRIIVLLFPHVESQVWIIEMMMKSQYLPCGQFSNTWWAMSPAESLGLNRNSFVFPLTRMRRRFIWKRKRNFYVN